MAKKNAIDFNTFVIQEELNKHAAHGNFEEVEKLLRIENIDINWKDTRYGMTPLICAASNGHIEVLRLLIAAGADLDLKDKVSDGGITALIEASKFNRIETVRELIRAGANINSHDIGGETALYIASRDGHVEIVSELLAAGALVNSKYSGGWTALHNAARGGHNGVVYELLRFGAEPKMKNNDNETAAEVGRNDEVKTTIGKAEAIRAKKLTEDKEKLKKEREEKEKERVEAEEKAAASLSSTTLSKSESVLLSAMGSPRSSLFKAQLIDKEVEIQMLKDQVVQMYAKMSFLEAENDSLRKRVVSLEQLQHTPAPGKSASSISEDGSGSGSGSSPEKARDRIVALESEVRQLREQNMQLKSTLKSVLSAT